MKCASCGAEVVEQSVYCHKCGHRVGQAGGALKQAAGAAADAPGGPDRILWDGSFSPKAMYGTYLVCLVLSVAILVGGLIFFPPAALAALLVWLWPLGVLAYRKLAVHYRLTPERFIHERGILKRVTDRIEVIDMDDITYEQGIIERMLGVGTLRITSSDRTHPKLILPGIDDVARVAGIVDDARRSERNRRGVYIESV
jgi:hypothetical protein